MPRDKTESHEKIVAAAFKEFLDYGFREASMRRIASACGMSASGLYKHFSSKEDMFAALVNPAIDGFMSLHNEIESDYFEELDTKAPGGLWVDLGETVSTMAYIYERFDEFKLIVCKSQGTKYEGFTHNIAEFEENATIRYLKALREKGIALNEIDKKELHLLVTANVEAVFQAVIHDFTEKEAMHYAETLEKFYIPAWKALFGL